LLSWEVQAALARRQREHLSFACPLEKIHALECRTYGVPDRHGPMVAQNHRMGSPQVGDQPHPLIQIKGNPLEIMVFEPRAVLFPTSFNF
jgi:hypothetical protein